MRNKTIVCRKCKYIYEWMGEHHCNHPSCFYSEFKVDPLYGKEGVKRRRVDYHYKNANLDCPDFKRSWRIIF